MSKRNVAFTKPTEPTFIARLKEQIGYKEGPTVDTKREALPQYNSDDSEGEDQQPVIVVVNPGDLSAEEAAKAKKELESEPADLDKKVLFKKPEKKRGADEGEGSGGGGKLRKKEGVRSKSSGKKGNKGPLSFSQEEDE